MRLRILGCHGGESPSHRASSFLVDDHLVLDAGALTRGLSLEQQLQVDHIFLSHSHMDHIRDLPMMADNIIGLRQTPVVIHGTEPTARALEQHVFNNVIWPDFTKIPNPANPKSPTLQIQRFAPGEVVQAGDYAVHTVPVTHTVDCQATFVRGKTGTLVYSGDTGPTEALWAEMNRLDDIRAFIFEVSFPNDMAQLAHVSGHLTPSMMAAELQKWHPKTRVPILLYHFKPGFHDVLKREVTALGDDRLIILKPMDDYEF